MNIRGMTFKKRYIALGVIAMEVASIPVAAQIVDKVSFSVPQKVIAVPFPPEVGLTKFLVASNAPFAVISENAIGEFEVNIEVSGILNGNRFGTNAQMPGMATACAMQSSAVIVEIRYDANIQPNLKIISENKAKRMPLGTTCDSSLS